MLENFKLKNNEKKESKRQNWLPTQGVDQHLGVHQLLEVHSQILKNTVFHTFLVFVGVTMSEKKIKCLKIPKTNILNSSRPTVVEQSKSSIT